MSKKTIIILASTVLGLLFISLVGYYFIIQSGTIDPATGKPLGFRSFLPFGGDNTPAEVSTTTNETANEPEVQNPQTNFALNLRKISTEQVSGAGVLDIKAGTIIRYIEKATGHIFEVETFSPRAGRISNTTIPVVYDAVWGNGATSLVARYLAEDDITVNTYSLALRNATSTSLGSTTPATETTISGLAFPGGISDVTASGASVFYLQQSTASSQGFVSNFDGSKKKMIWSSEIKELNSQFVNDKTVALTTKSYPNISGFLYFVDTGTGAVKSILNNVSGLTTLVNNFATSLVYLEQKTNLTFSLFDIKTRIATPISPVTFPEKCVWSKKDTSVIYCAVPRELLNNSSLTMWYRGLASFTDDIWKYNLKENTSTIVENLVNDSGEQIDATRLTLSDSEQYLVFINKIDNTLWSLDLTK